MKFPNKYLTLLTAILLLLSALASCAQIEFSPYDTGESVYTEKNNDGHDDASSSLTDNDVPSLSGGSVSLKDIPAFSGDFYVPVNGNVPFFTEDEITDVSFEYYSPLDSLGRCGACMASVGQDLMPTEKRGDIYEVKPTGWHSVQYDFVDGKSLYNRCHLLGFQLTGENANRENLITGTRTMNTKGMLPFENMVADFVHEECGHVMYRVTPLFDGDNLVADGVLMEGYSVEDEGDTVMFCVFCYNVEPGVIIDYKTGNSREASSSDSPGEPRQDTGDTVVYLPKSGSRYHKVPNCSGMKNSRRSTEKEALSKGFTKCPQCW